MQVEEQIVETPADAVETPGGGVDTSAQSDFEITKVVENGVETEYQDGKPVGGGLLDEATGNQAVETPEVPQVPEQTPEAPETPAVPDTTPAVPQTPEVPETPVMSFEGQFQEKMGISMEDAKSAIEAASLLKDDYIRKAAEYYNAEGTMSPYLQAHSLDFENMSAREIIKYDLKQENQGVSDQTLDYMVDLKLKNEYSQIDLPPEQDEDGTPTPGRDELVRQKQAGTELLELHTARRKGELKQWQEGFKAPERKPVETPDFTPQIAAFVEKVQGDEATKGLRESKQVNVAGFNLAIENPDSVINMVLDDSNFWGLFNKGEGVVDFDKAYKAMAFAKDPDGVAKALIDHGRSLAKAEIAKGRKNAHVPGSPLPVSEQGDFTNIRETGGQ